MTSISMSRSPTGFCELTDGHINRFMMLLTVALTRAGLLVLVTRDHTTSPADLPTARGWAITDGTAIPMPAEHLKHLIDDSQVICATP